MTLSAEAPKNAGTKSLNRAHSTVFQPQKLKEVVEIIDLMGNIASRVREDNSGDLGSGGAAQAQKGSGGTQGSSARDEAIAKAPPVPIMQKKLVQYLEKEVKNIQRQVRKTRNAKTPGSAYIINELYKKIRSLTALISRILHASTNLVKRFYVSVFIDHQPLIITGNTLLGQDGE